MARIKRAAEPVERRPVFFVLGIFDSLQESVIAPDPATVFRRTGVPSIQANRILRFRVSGKDLLDYDFMRPAVAEIVFVNKGRFFVSCDFSPAGGDDFVAFYLTLSEYPRAWQMVRMSRPARQSGVGWR